MPDICEYVGILDPLCRLDVEWLKKNGRPITVARKCEGYDCGCEDFVAQRTGYEAKEKACAEA